MLRNEPPKVTDRKKTATTQRLTEMQLVLADVYCRQTGTLFIVCKPFKYNRSPTITQN